MSKPQSRFYGQKKKRGLMRSFTALIALTAFFLQPFHSLAMGANSVDHFDLSPEQLFGATVMSASKIDEKLWDAPAAIYVLTNEDIKRSGATSIPQALRLVPGVQVGRVNASGWAISVRGFNNALSNKLLVLMDGREVYDSLFSGVYWDIQDTALEDIDRIEVIRGPGASLWGANAVNGVINIITKNSADTQGSLASLTAGNEERVIGTGRYGGTMKNGGTYRVYGKYLNRDDNLTLGGDSANDDWQAFRSGFRTDWKESSNENFTVQGDVYRTESSQLRNVPSITAPYSQLQTESVDAQGGNLLGRWNKQLEDKARLTVQAYLDYTARDQMLLEDDRIVLDLEGQYEFPEQGDHKFLTGLRYRYSADDLTETPFITFQDGNRADQTISGFIQDKITLAPDEWFLTVGSKFEHNDYSGFEIQPNARLQWHPNDQQMVWASVSHAVRTPNRLEHDLNIFVAAFPPGVLSPDPTRLELDPSPGFDSEQLTAFEIGYRHQITPSLLWDFAAFYNDYNDLSTIEIRPGFAGGPPPQFVVPLVYTNSTKAETYGFESVFNWRATDSLNFTATYSLLDLQFHGPPSTIAVNSEVAEQQSPNHQLNLRSQWNINESVMLDTMLYYTDSLPNYQVSNYWRLDMRLGWQIEDGIEFSLVGQNLLDPTHREFGSVPEAMAAEIERSIYGNVTWRF